MKNRLYQYLSIVAVVLLFAALTPLVTSEGTTPESQASEKEQVLMDIISKVLENKHYAPQKMDDELSKKVYNLYIERLDYSKKFFTQVEINKLKAYELQLDDQLSALKVDFFDLSNSLLKKRIVVAQDIYSKILKKPFDFEVNEEIELDAEKLDFAADKKELQERWRKYLKYQTLLKLTDLIQKQDEAIKKSDTVTVKSVVDLEVAARKKVLKDHNQWFTRMNKLNRQDRFSTFMNSFTAVFDPHTNYYPPKDKANFDISLSGRLEGIGATLQETDGYIKVTRIVPGSASWRQGELKSGDLILAVGQAEEEAVDIVDMRLDEAVQLIRGKKGTEVRLTVKKGDGTIQIISIIRDVVVLEETYAKSAIVKDEETGRRIGYVNLPKFYADFNNKGGRSCAQDVKNEIIKLQGDNIDGLIVDVRDNGGGSLRDVVDMGGLFVKDGPMVQIKNRTGAPFVYSDTDTSVLYGGPMVVMVNSLSASASEILAAAMQDYKRAVIVGSAATYGKGTVQRFEQLDPFLGAAYQSVLPLGDIKLTTSKFYRVNGGATQWRGVIPDIILPDTYTYIEVGEKELDHSLEWDEIEKANYNKWPNAIKGMKKIVAHSQERTTTDSSFVLIDEKAKRFKKLREKTIYSLNLKVYQDNQKREREEGKKYDGIMKKDVDNMFVEIPSFDISKAGSDTTQVARNTEFKEKIQKDIYIYEAAQIVQDID